ncbi:MAG: acetolactate synthase [Candidatus Magasanikbacteria bacterium CG10_big_fil_rev_8_21_14_0_10_36_32]|uniref:Acetolactate synthase n=1 Tax=Candidatus Magasanikbacteria bacterium CG10_big_fil_rev_8_21_14_0_10_36_32 TaxID=1974646 RepID=A0A2M6W5U1_9BACT|nr:MAG: acetolactate synthase [Candidatus Magasanikbacteria bacterium CG10_big_fil_rev_8_21_14_0_10_36_32]
MILSDFIFKFLSEKGVDQVFMVTGGQAMFLDDAVYKNKKMKYVCTHHEQTAGMAADAYGRIKNKPAVALITAGPGAVNVINGVVGGWTDSSPMIILSGQSNLSYVEYQEKTGIRQYGVQGINIKPLVENVVKYFVTVDNPENILYYLEKAYHLATSGRPGPVWIDVPVDMQRVEVADGYLRGFDEYSKKEIVETGTINKIIELLNRSKRPIVLAGQGVRLSGGAEEFIQLIKKMNIPVLTSRLGIDLINSDNKLYVGRPGTYGERAANFAIQNSDLILAIGCRLATPLIGHDAKDFGRRAKKIVIDIDQKELDKPGLEIDLKVKADANDFIKELMKSLGNVSLPDYNKWIEQCNYWKEKYPVVLPDYKNEKPVNSYYFTDKLSQMATKNDLILLDTGSCFHVVCQAWKVKEGQKFLTTGGLSSMGYWAAGIGACEANDRKRTIVITGDGSLQMNLQEFATIKHNNLPIKVFVFNNNGYLLIRHTQNNFMDGRLIGEGPSTGVWCPDSVKIAEAYGIHAVRIDSVAGIEEKIKEVLEYNGPVICDVMTPELQLLIPRVASDKMPDGSLVSRPYEDMFPFLSKEELQSNVIKDS